ncbi:MAG TPA: tRNA uridine-5-carboxymethylaminomethyl(34) synthesis GTPase MnmE [Thermomicrobiales bacterium]|nr:tRNA uridine-5-carboxymethylaminomethyl(34) synthesis GTPase MnmE [Thermomicrobiales bacterium]
MYQDTIAAIATAVGEGGIGIVRLSGPEAGAVAGRVFRRTGLRRILPPHRLVYGRVIDPESGATLDEALAVRMPPPHSYTREEVVEIHCHGGAVATREVLRACLRAGARHAERGEFTLRAFVNGRLDLTQAEAVLGIVGARTPEALHLAVAGLRGRLGGELRPARDRLVDALAYLDAAADFPEDEIPPADVGAALAEAADRLDALARRAAVGVLYREGLRVAIVGRPNVGKSSLLNALLRQERAIVTPVAGTTRDVIAESVTLRGIPVTLLDTAGIAETADAIERLGVARSHEALAAAALALFVLDASAPPTPDDLAVAATLRDRLGADDAARRVLLALNKADLGAAPQDAVRALLPGAPAVALSALTGAGLPDLEDALYTLAVGEAPRAAEADPALATVRQRETLALARDHARHGVEALAAGVPLDLVAVDARAALVAVGELTGETASEAVLEAIFARFCIGK